MPSEKTRADSIRFYNTGATADGNAQTDPNASFGNFRSGTEMQPLTVSVTNPISNVTVDFVAGKSGAGVGTMNAPTSDTLTYSAPGGTTGSSVTILSGETKILEDGTDNTKFVRVTRTSATALAGTATLTLSINQSNSAGFDTVSSTERIAGDVNYRMVGIKNETTGNVNNINIQSRSLGTQQLSDVSWLAATGAGTIGTSGSFADWPDRGFCFVERTAGDTATAELVYYSSRTTTVLTVPSYGRDVGNGIDSIPTSGTAGASGDKLFSVPGILLQKDAPATQNTGAFANPANEATKPSVIDGSFYVYPGSVAANKLSIGTLAAGQIYAVCLARAVPAGQDPDGSVDYGFDLTFDAP